MSYYPNTNTQRYLEYLGACSSARKWVGKKPLSLAWTRCQREAWMLWLLWSTIPHYMHDRLRYIEDEIYRLHPPPPYVPPDHSDRARYEAELDHMSRMRCNELRRQFKCPELPWRKLVAYAPGTNLQLVNEL